MKNVFLYVGLFVLLSMKGHSQGTDVIFLIDNSGSVDNTEYGQMYTSIQNVMSRVLNCNPANRVSVVQYHDDGEQQIFIERDFGSSSFTFIRRFDNYSGGNTPRAVNLLSYAVNGIVGPSSSVPSTQKTLNQITGNSLAVYLFTDAQRDYDLLSNNAGVSNNNAGFAAFVDFKIDHDAKFIVTNTHTDALAKAASAGIASVGGSYTGAVEYYSNDPDGGGVSPRLFLDSSFELSPGEIDVVTEYICSVTPVSCVPNLTLSTSAGHNVLTGAQDNREAGIQISASNAIAANGVGIYHAGQGITLTSGFHSANNSRFRAYIADCNSGYVGRNAETSRSSAIAEETKFFSLSPNPATSSFTVKSSIDIQHITVTSFDGKMVYDSNIKGKTTSHTIDIGGYIPGFYIVNVLSQTGETQTQKLIKN